MDERHAPAILHLRPGEKKETIDQDGVTWRVRLFHVVAEDGSIVTDTTDEGEQPLMVQTVPMKVAKAAPTFGLIGTHWIPVD